MHSSRRALGSVLVALAVGVLMVPTSGPVTRAWAGGDTSASKVKISASASKPDDTGKQKVVIALVIEKGWHLYANPVKNDSLEGAETVVRIKSASGSKLAKVNYPPGTLHKDKIVGDFHIYEGNVNIEAIVERGAADRGPLVLSVSVNACSDKVCLRGSTLTVEVP